MLQFVIIIPASCDYDVRLWEIVIIDPDRILAAHGGSFGKASSEEIAGALDASGVPASNSHQEDLSLNELDSLVRGNTGLIHTVKIVLFKQFLCCSREH